MLLNHFDGVRTVTPQTMKPAPGVGQPESKLVKDGRGLDQVRPGSDHVGDPRRASISVRSFRGEGALVE